SWTAGYGRPGRAGFSKTAVSGSAPKGPAQSTYSVAPSRALRSGCYEAGWELDSAATAAVSQWVHGMPGQCRLVGAAVGDRDHDAGGAGLGAALAASAESSRRRCDRRDHALAPVRDPGVAAGAPAQRKRCQLVCNPRPADRAAYAVGWAGSGGAKRLG